MTHMEDYQKSSTGLDSTPAVLGLSFPYTSFHLEGWLDLMIDGVSDKWRFQGDELWAPFARFPPALAGSPRRI